MRLLSLAALAALSLIACRNEPEPVDADGDGVVEADDCNDAVATVFPGAAETCNGVDDNCDGVIDNEASDAITYYQDADADGFGATGKAVTGCDAPAGYVTADADCDDLDATSFPGASEEDCTDPVDHNCDGSVGYADADADGFAACLDCDDTAAAVNPDASELCDGLDNNCDGNTDEAGAAGEATWYADADADGQGNPRDVRIACDQPTGYVSNADDCNDAAAASLKGGVEVCDGLDNDCDGTVDLESTDAATWYHDGDLDAHGNAGLSVLACAQPVGFVASSDDCNDNNPTAYPGATEVCDTVDNNCDNATDEGVGATWYQDADRDGHGLAGTAQQACTTPAGYVASSDDCNDANNKAYPGATEVCDDVDNNCDSAVDEGFNKTWYIDYDEDNYGKTRVSVQSCSQPMGFVKDGGDCDDLNPALNPAATEVCDTIDNDCDTKVDDADSSVTGQTTWYTDVDLDTFGDVNGTVLACVQPDARIADGGDCNDSSDAINPNADELCDGVDNNCDGVVDEDTALDAATWYVDADGDGFGDGNVTMTTCAQPIGYVDNSNDCDDTDPSVGLCGGEWVFGFYNGSPTVFDTSVTYNGTVSCSQTCAASGRSAVGARFICNAQTRTAEGCSPTNDGMYGTANCGMMVRDMVVVTENGNNEDCTYSIGPIMACVTGTCSEPVTYHAIECQCQ